MRYVYILFCPRNIHAFYTPINVQIELLLRRNNTNRLNYFMLNNDNQEKTLIDCTNVRALIVRIVVGYIARPGMPRSPPLSDGNLALPYGRLGCGWVRFHTERQRGAQKKKHEKTPFCK